MKLIQRISGMLGFFFPSNTIKVKDDDFSECDFFFSDMPRYFSQVGFLSFEDIQIWNIRLKVGAAN